MYFVSVTKCIVFAFEYKIDLSFLINYRVAVKIKSIITLQREMICTAAQN